MMATTAAALTLNPIFCGNDMLVEGFERNQTWIHHSDSGYSYASIEFYNVTLRRNETIKFYMSYKDESKNYYFFRGFYQTFGDFYIDTIEDAITFTKALAKANGWELELLQANV